MKTNIKESFRKYILESAINGNDKSLETTGLFITDDYITLFDFVNKKNACNCWGL